MFFWYFRSTSGRYNAKLNRFERWGVKSEEEWYNHQYYVKETYETMEGKIAVTRVDYQMLQRSNFFIVRNKLVEMGLIESESHLRRGSNKEGDSLAKAVWIKPTEEASPASFSSRATGRRSGTSTPS